jgi:hypothetical protein
MSGVLQSAFILGFSETQLSGNYTFPLSGKSEENITDRPLKMS